PQMMIHIRSIHPRAPRALDLLLAVAFALALAVSPATAQQNQPAPADSSAPRRPARASWTDDGRDYSIGDGLTVLLDEYTLAAADRSATARSSRSTDADLSVSQDLVRNNPSIPSSAGAGLGSGRNVESAERGEHGAQNRFEGEITVRVTGVEGSRMRIEGKKRVQIDRGWQEVTLTGWVTPSDVSSGNLVESRRVGDLQLTYTSRGGPSQGLLSRIVGFIWP
ncbi:flagellar basal body L-ring protein FlgH, partial [Longimicrobium sp.]|uniref:flagellar basal body L-ring protein FlgH n=1 Tax=Longimicrobium sp. TaxID=2029185 RepID=UPI002E30C9E7